MSEIKTDGRDRNMTVINGFEISAVCRVGFLPLKDEPIIRRAAGIVTLLNIDKTLVTLALAGDEGLSDVFGVLVGKIDIDQHIVRPTRIKTLANALRRKIEGRLPFYL